MDYRVTVRTYTGTIRTVEVKDMPNEEAARAEAVAMTFGRVQSVELIDKKHPRKRRRSAGVEFRRLRNP